MISALESITADRVEYKKRDSLFLSCHHQHITKESINEELPYYDSEADILLVADAIIDNRIELLKIFGIPTSEWGKYTDSQLILLSYKKWGEECSKYLLGDYTFVIYEEKTKKMLCVRDQMGRSTFYYTLNDSYFAFCSIMKPLVRINNDKVLSERWMADFLSIPTVIGELDTSLTVYRSIRQLPPANKLILKDNKTRISRYWSPLGAKRIRYKNDSDYDEAFREVLTESVKCKLRSIGNIGILLSGGFDSCTVACTAAGLLQSEGKKLRSYTSIPMEGYIETLSKVAMTDESPFVNEIIGMYPNIDTTFCRSEGKDSFSGIPEYLEIIEQPYKVVENFFWNHDIYEEAKQDGCKVMLSGQYGNVNISYGDFFTNFHTLLCSGKFIKLFHEIQEYSRNYNVGRKKTIKEILYGFMPILKTTKKSRFIRSFPLVNPEFAQVYNVEARLDKAKYGDRDYRNMTMREFQKLVTNHPMLSQIAGFERKLDIHNSLVTRDPTKDIRLTEFCFGLPADQFVRNGRDKVILRRSMKGIIPEKIRLNYTKKGVQAADWVQRIIPLWEDIKTQIAECVSDKRIEKYVNSKDIISFLNENKELTLSVNSVDLRQAISAYIFSQFLFNSKQNN